MSEHRCTLNVVEAQLPPLRRLVEAGTIGEPRCEVVSRIRHAPHRQEVPLLVEHEALGVHLPIEVDRQLRHPGDRFAHVQQMCFAVGVEEVAGETEVAVEPGVVEDSSVDLDAELLPAVAHHVGSRFDAQAWRVGVRTGEAERGVRRGAGGNPPGDERAAAHGTARFGHGVPGIGLVDALETRQAVDGGDDRVSWRG